jgi:periplasmic divalent cation tolerance protein
MNAKYQVVFCTVPNFEVAREIARGIVSDKLAACCNIIPGITSIYTWKNEIQEDSELLLMIKTKESTIPELTEKIKKLHPYEVPEIITLNINQGNSEYLNWVNENVK